ncbi:MAG: hypothetical protein LBH15_01265, partial [Treponema sp.]|nr:hypothetical protein [Treponema sp.]
GPDLVRGSQLYHYRVEILNIPHFSSYLGVLRGHPAALSLLCAKRNKLLGPGLSLRHNTPGL